MDYWGFALVGAGAAGVVGALVLVALAALVFWLGGRHASERIADKAEIRRLTAVIQEMISERDRSGYNDFLLWQAKRNAKRGKHTD